MKKYILRGPNSVEPQIKSPITDANPEVNALTKAILALHLPTSPSPRVLFIGLDVHKDSIAVSLAPSESSEARRSFGGPLEIRLPSRSLRLSALTSNWNRWWRPCF
jgi:hypothetical protein